MRNAHRKGRANRGTPRMYDAGMMNTRFKGDAEAVYAWGYAIIMLSCKTMARKPYAKKACS